MHKNNYHSEKKDKRMESELQQKHFPGRSVYVKITLEHLSIGLNSLFQHPVLTELTVHNIQERSDVAVFNTDENKGYY